MAKRTLEELQRELVGKRFERKFVATREQLTIDPEKRTIRVAFSSEFPVERWFGDEILDHSPDSVLLDRINTVGSYLNNHDTDKKLGWVVPGTAAVESDRMGRADVRYSTRQSAEDEWQDALAGAPVPISVGYIIHELKLEETGDAGDKYRVTKWEPIEISLAPVPADITVGGGRSLDEGARDAEDEDELCPDCELPLADCTCERGKSAGDAEGRSEEKPTIEVRSNEMENEQSATLRQTFEQEGEFFKSIVPDAPAMARAFFAEGKTVADFRAAILEKNQQSQAARDAGKPLIDLNEHEREQYSICRAILANADRTSGKPANSFELEISETLRKDLNSRGVENRGGLLVPTGVALRGMQMQRTPLTAGGSGTGAETIFTEAGGFIDLLRNKAMVIQLGATVLTGLRGPVSFTRQTGGGVLYWTGENSGADVTESNATLDLVTLSAKSAMARESYSRQLLTQGSYSADQIVNSDLVRIAALGVDRAALHGSGSSNQPTGVYGLSGVNAVAYGGPLTFAKTVEMETKVATANADISAMAYLTTPGVRGNGKTTLKFSAAGSATIWEDGEVNGYRAEVTNQISSTMNGSAATGGSSHGIVFGCWDQLLIGEWGAMELLTDPYTLAGQALIRVILFLMADINARHGESFAKGTGLTVT